MAEMQYVTETDFQNEVLDSAEPVLVDFTATWCPPCKMLDPVVKQLAEDSLDVVVPAMILQPLVENSIKHGLGRKVEGGTIYLRSKLIDGHLIIEVQDNGVGMGTAQFLEPPTGMGGSGIGMANVADRLKVLYGDSARLSIEAIAEGGTLVRITLPLVQPYELGLSVATAYSEARSSTSR